MCCYLNQNVKDTCWVYYVAMNITLVASYAHYFCSKILYLKNLSIIRYENILYRVCEFIFSIRISWSLLGSWRFYDLTCVFESVLQDLVHVPFKCKWLLDCHALNCFNQLRLDFL